MGAVFLGASTDRDMAPVVACPHNRIKQSVTKVQAPLENVGWAHTCRCCDNIFMERNRHAELCRRCRGPAIHGWRASP